MKHIFVVDDEKNIRELIEKYLVNEGYKATCFEHGIHLVEEIKKQNPDLLVLDITLPMIDGLELLKEIRKISDLPVIFVSARDEALDRILGLELGADDYLPKPFSPRELMVRIKNVFKRSDKSQGIQELERFKDLSVDKNNRRICCNDIDLKLTSKEFEVLEFLIRNHGRTYSREMMIETIWGYDYAGDGRAVDDLIKRLRKKLKSENSVSEIETVWGLGYRLNS